MRSAHSMTMTALLVGQKLFELDGVRGAVAFGEAVEVQVIEDESAFAVAVDEGEGGACDLGRVKSESGGEPLREDGLARAERAAQEQDLAAPQALAHATPGLERLFRRARSPDPRLHRVLRRGRVQGVSPFGSSARTAAPRYFLTSDATIVLMPRSRAARSPASPAT